MKILALSLSISLAACASANRPQPNKLYVTDNHTTNAIWIRALDQECEYSRSSDGPWTPNMTDLTGFSDQSTLHTNASNDDTLRCVSRLINILERSGANVGYISNPAN